MKAIILRGEHVIFLVLPSKYSSIPKRKIGQKLLFHNCRSIGWLVIICQVHPSGKYIPTVILLSQYLLYKSAFHGSHLSCNMPLRQWCNNLNIPSFMMGIFLFDLVSYGRVILLSVSCHWNLCLEQKGLYYWNSKHLLYYLLVYKTSSYTIIC